VVIPTHELDGMVALVVGAGEGIGRSCALAYARAGADVVVAARRREPLEALAAEVATQTGRTVVPVPTDISDLAACRSLVDRTVDELGSVDAVVNVATTSGGRGQIVDLNLDTYLHAFQLNVLGTLEVSRTAAQHMRDRGGGAIVQISTLGVHARGEAQAAYTSTKAAMISASFTMAKEVGPFGVRVNVVTPGYTTGANLDAMFANIAAATGRDPVVVSERAAQAAALRRHVDPDDIAEAVLFLSSPRSRCITGVELRVDAGQWTG
jgi:NAD(P)-dependent dehydrogenase (short-subunit alcohol dehydrogenase family)